MSQKSLFEFKLEINVAKKIGGVDFNGIVLRNSAHDTTKKKDTSAEGKNEARA